MHDLYPEEDFLSQLQPAERRQLIICCTWCSKQGKMLTPIRQMVLILLRRSENGLKAYELLRMIKEIKPKASPPTVYRALDFLVASSLIYKVNSSSVYVACTKLIKTLPTLLLTCPRCKTVTEITDCQSASMMAGSITSLGHKLEHEIFEVSAVCPACLQLTNTRQD